MELLLGIATYKRTDKLQRLIHSIVGSSYKNWTIVIVADNGDIETQNYIQQIGYNIVVLVQKEPSYVIGAWNRIVKEFFMPCSFDGFIGLCDDVELYKNSLEISVNEFKTRYSDTDGVLGFKQECPGHPEYQFKYFGQTLMGRKWIERYKEAGYQICCPNYKHFYQDEEMFEYSQSLGKFYCSERSILKHYHPSFISEEIDDTHKIIRYGNNSPRLYDDKAYNKRKGLNLVWGKSWGVVNV